jgi:hypothetical protein
MLTDSAITPIISESPESLSCARAVVTSLERTSASSENFSLFFIGYFAIKIRIFESYKQRFMSLVVNFIYWMANN